MSTTQNNKNSGKLSLLNAPENKATGFPHLDSRYDEIETPNEFSIKEIESKCFYNTLIRKTKKLPEKFPTLILRHPNAADCPIGTKCDHWELIKDDKPTRAKGSIELEIICKYSLLHCRDHGITYRDQGWMLHDWMRMKEFDVECRPTKMYKGLEPDFWAARPAGFQVLAWRLVEDVMHSGTWMDDSGRLVCKYPAGPHGMDDFVPEGDM
ncbi:hypothetical protein IL306_010848 [Fusarium sp. DS 682]|nr:hypothetical protein IL306_010848 [Fusarium sp. DS 682]